MPVVDDPLAYDKIPSLFGKGTAVGTTITGTIAKPLAKVQDVVFGTKTPKTWPDGNPVYKVVVTLALPTGELRSVWAQVPSALFRALQHAQQEANAGPMAVGGTLVIKYTGTEPNKNPAYQDAKQYIARYTPPPPDNPFADEFAPEPAQREASLWKPAPAPQGQRTPAEGGTGPGTLAHLKTAPW